MRTYVLLLIAISPCLLAQNATLCKDVGGAVSTNFLDAGSTLGSATGDLSGGIGVSVLSVTSGQGGTLIFHNHHQWVTASGDTIYLADADATAFPTPIAGLYGLSYTKGVKITGGTGRFANATGNLPSFYGAVDQTAGQVVLRYQGRVCSPIPAGPE
jgi:hypothetical protein